MKGQLYVVSLRVPQARLMTGQARMALAIQSTMRKARRLQAKLPGCTVYAVAFKPVVRPIRSPR